MAFKGKWSNPSGSRTYYAWRSMRDRCYNPKNLRSGTTVAEELRFASSGATTLTSSLRTWEWLQSGSLWTGSTTILATLQKTAGGLRSKSNSTTNAETIESRTTEKLRRWRSGQKNLDCAWTRCTNASAECRWSVRCSLVCWPSGNTEPVMATNFTSAGVIFAERPTTSACVTDARS